MAPAISAPSCMSRKNRPWTSIAVEITSSGSIHIGRPFAQMVGADDIIYPQYILRHRDHFGDRQSVSRGLIQQFAATAAYSVAETAAPEVEMIAYIKRRRQSKARQGADRLHRQLRSIRFGRKGHAQPQSLPPGNTPPSRATCRRLPRSAGYGLR